MPSPCLGASGSDVWVAQGGGMVVGYLASGPDGCTRGLSGYGCSNAQAAGCNEGSVSVGVGSGGHNEGDGKEGGRGRIGLVDRDFITCISNKKIVTLKMSNEMVQCVIV